MPMMRAAVLAGYGEPLQIRQVPQPVAGRGQLLVRLKACGICHSDVHIWKGDVLPPHAPEPFILGHEGVGVVEAVGEGVEGWAAGDTVGVPWLHDTCLRCDECSDGHEAFCQHQRAHGLNVPGGFADYVAVDAAFAVALPADVDPLATAPVMCAGVTAYGAIRRAGVVPGEHLAVFGCGGLGLYAVQIAARMGVHVLAVDRDPAKLEHARSYGAAEVMTAGPDLDRHLAGGARYHAAINFAPTPATWAAIVASIRPRGRIVAAALVSEPVPLVQEWLTATGVTITGTSVGTRQEMREVVAMHARQPLLNPIEEIDLARATEALEALASGQAKGRYVIRY
ncbi:alcohol dehydrogenase catalytic domain-containing protein [Shinella lacus]|nr:alcohol dehydrogenase catalytic domain-containing protein [Shinella lacus]